MGTVGSLDEVAGGGALEELPLLRVIEEAQAEEITHLLILVKRHEHRSLYLLTADHLLTLESLNGFASFGNLRNSRNRFDEEGVPGKPLEALSKRDRSWLLKTYRPYLRTEELKALRDSDSMSRFSLAELYGLAKMLDCYRRNLLTDRNVEDFGSNNFPRFPKYDQGFWEPGKRQLASKRPASGFGLPFDEAIFYERRLKGVLVEF